MLSRANRTPVQAAVSAAIPRRSQATRLPLQYPRLRNERGFTLAELLVSVGVLVLLVLLATQLLNSAARIITLGHKQMDADSQARQLLDRIAVDFAQMVKRSDVDYFAKGTAAPNSVGGTMTGNDQLAFYSTVPGYYPASGSQSAVSLVAYRVNSTFNKMERLGKGLVWNAVSTADIPVVFLPLVITNTWPYATNQSPDPSSASAYETMGAQVFRFEYYYLLKNGSFSGTPWDTNATLVPPHASVSGMQDVSAIVADVAVIDSRSKVLLTDTQVTTLAAGLSDYAAGMVPGQLRANWQAALNANTSLPRPAISGIRLYERSFYLSPPTLLTAPIPSPTPTPTPIP